MVAALVSLFWTVVLIFLILSSKVSFVMFAGVKVSSAIYHCNAAPFRDPWIWERTSSS